MQDFVTKDSGQRREFQTGAKRDRTSGKGRYDLIPPMLLERYAKVLERGADKYGPNNWQKGMPLSCFIDSAMRHVSQLAAGDRDEDHAFQAVFNLVGYEWTRNEIIEGRLPAALADHVGDPVSELLTAIDKEAGEVEDDDSIGFIDGAPARGKDRRRENRRESAGGRRLDYPFGRRKIDTDAAQYPRM